MSVLDILNQLATTPSRNEKIAILKENKKNELLKEVVRVTLDPFTQFYIRKIPAYKNKPICDVDLWEAMSRLELLSTRQVTGNAGIELLTNLLTVLQPDDAQVVERIIAKDLKCGVSDSTANKIWKDLVPTYPCMLASAFEQKLVDKMVWPAIAQVKLDGMRFNAIVVGDKVEFRSRNGKELMIESPLFKKAFLDMASLLKTSEDIDAVVFDGELLVVNETGQYLDRQTGNGILNKAGKGTISLDEASQIRAIVWDMIPALYFRTGKYPVSYSNRFRLLSESVAALQYNVAPYVSVVESQPVKDYAQAQKVFEAYYAAGQEGIILKSHDGIWEDKRAKHQIKFKGELECDLKVVGLQEGTGKYRGMLGAILCESEDGVVKVSVGSGFNDEHRRTGVPVGSIVAVKYNQRIKNTDGEQSLFLPIFIEVRSDKNKADKSKDIK